MQRERQQRPGADANYRGGFVDIPLRYTVKTERCLRKAWCCGRRFNLARPLLFSITFWTPRDRRTPGSVA